MNYTKIADVIQPELFTQYVIDKTTEKSEIMMAGIIENDPELNQLVSGGGTVIKMPKWNDLSGKSQVLSDTNPLEVNKITSKVELATLLIRGNAWGAHELAGALAGDDPMRAIVNRVSDWWVRDEKNNVISILNGIFASASMSDLVMDASTKVLNAELVLDAKQKMGDASDLLSTIYMHSATFTELQKQNLINSTTTIGVSNSQIVMPTYLGYRVVVDDSIPASDGVYTTYLLSRGFIRRGIGTPISLTSTEFDRDSLGSTDILINRQAKVLHPRGISWIGAGSITDSTPSDEELATGTNWNRVSDIKQVGIVKLLHKLV